MARPKKEEYWSRYAHTYDEYAEYVLGKGLRRAVALKLSGEHDLGEAVECGCGTGYYTKVIARNSRRLIAIDLSDEMLEVAEKRLKRFNNVLLQKGDCEDLSLPSEGSDAVVLANILHIIGKPAKVLGEAYRVLRNSGRLLIVCYTDYGMTWFEKMELGIRYFRKFGPPPARGLRNYSPAGLSSLVGKSGFRVEETLLIGGGPKALFLKGRKSKRRFDDN